MNAKKLKIGMKVRMSNKNTIIKVLSTCPHNSDTGNNFWFKGVMIDLCGTVKHEYNFVGYTSYFNVDFAKPC